MPLDAAMACMIKRLLAGCAQHHAPPAWPLAKISCMRTWNGEIHAPFERIGLV